VRNTARPSVDRDGPTLFDLVEAGEEQAFARLCCRWGVQTGPGWPDAFGTALRRWARRSHRQPVRTISLFTGAGGLDIGFHDAGFDILEMVEISPNYSKTLDVNAAACGHFGKGLVSTIDIFDYDPARWTREGEGVDFIIGGPPCQTFSAAGRRAAGVLGTKERRGTLFQEYVRILRRTKPRGFVFENVYGITGAEGGGAWQRIREAFASVGYRLFFRILDSADYGVPQHRERMIIVGVRDGTYMFPRPTHGPDSVAPLPYFTASEAITAAPASEYDLPPALDGKYGRLLTEVPPGLNYSYFTEKMGHPRPLFAWRSKFSDFLYKADPDWPVRTIKAFSGKYTGPFHWDNRRFTIAELKRLQTFPDAYDMVGSRGVVMQQIGNSVPPQMARILALTILNQVFGLELPVRLPLLRDGEHLGFRTRKKNLASEYERRARAAIGRLAPSSPARAKSALSFSCDIDDQFRLLRRRRGLRFTASVQHVGRDLVVRLTDGDLKRAAFRIEVVPAGNRPWILRVQRIVLASATLDRAGFVCAWKASEVWMSENHIKDDWVQLCGYFAYEPAISCRMELFADNGQDRDTWRTVAKVVAGRAVRSIMTIDDCADALDVGRTRIRDLLAQLKAFGYEVRSHKTNPQLPRDSVLIPYSFPTFTHRSVQLYKDLF